MGAGWCDEEKKMSRTLKKMIHVGRYVAEVDIEIEESTDDWAPYISLQDALRMDEVREALQRGDIISASKEASVFEISPVQMKVAEDAAEYKTRLDSK
jgi:Asp-tRNA(Asn)/Glu-tRNA(Gln) amidotransferase C subunit